MYQKYVRRGGGCQNYTTYVIAGGKTGMREGITLDEQETILNITPAQISSRISVYSSISADMRYYKKLAVDHPAEVSVIREDEYGIEIQIPSSWFRRPKPPNKRQVSDEQRAAMAARLAAAREKRKGGGRAWQSGLTT
jgi:hypothetical protein